MKPGAAAVAVILWAWVSSAAAQTTSDTEQALFPSIILGAAVGAEFGGAGPNPMAEVHAGGGIRLPHWRIAGIVAADYVSRQALLASWSTSTTLVWTGPVVVFRPFLDDSFNIHGFLGGGKAFDGVQGSGPEVNASRLASIAGFGLGWGVGALTLVYASPASICQPPVSDGPTICFGGGDGWQVFLSVSADLLALPSAPPPTTTAPKTPSFEPP